MRIWAETGQPPESTLRFALIHAIVRCCLTAIWIWHGLVPKLLYHHIDELAMLDQAGLPAGLLPWIGSLEIMFGLLILGAWRWRRLFLVNIAVMVLATLAVAWHSSSYLQAAFNPVTLNLAVITLSIVVFALRLGSSHEVHL